MMMRPMTPEQLELFKALTELQKTVATLVLSGMTYAQAYRVAKPDYTGANTTASSHVKQILDKPNVKAWMDSMRESIVDEAIVTRKEALMRLSNIARASLAEMVDFGTFQVGEDADGEPVYQSTWKFKNSSDLDPRTMAAISELKANARGITLKLHSPLTAIGKLAEMEGWDKPKRVDHTSSDGSMSRSNIDASDLSESAMEEILRAADK